MFVSPIISSDRHAREVAREIEEISSALSSQQVLKAVVQGLPREVIEGVRRALEAERRDLTEALEAYASAKNGDCSALMRRAEGDPGTLLIVARLAKGWSQKDLARKLGLREQAIQRYESERYRSIALAGFLRVAGALSVRLTPTLGPRPEDLWAPSFKATSAETQKVLKHARANNWLQRDDDSDEKAISQLVRHVTEHVEAYGTPSLLRTGLNVVDHTDDWSLLSWKAQVTRRAEAIIERSRPKYSPRNISWLIDLVQLSALDDGPRQSQALLLHNGIVLIAEPHISGMKIDGAAFLVDQVPVIGLTVLRDTLDNFWFTLIHEVAHVILHYRTGLASGFFDDVETPSVDEMEAEANRFAENLLIPEEVWSRSPARIAKTPDPIERLASQLGISASIIFGRIRMERKNYSLFADRLGRGKVRKQLFNKPPVVHQ